MKYYDSASIFEIHSVPLLIVSSSQLVYVELLVQFTEPIGGEITVACESEMDKNSPKTSIERALDAQLGTGKFSASTSVDRSKKRGCYYTTIPRVIKRRGMEGKELTSLNLDKVKYWYVWLLNYL
jgi:hypothetical protein